MKKFTSILVGAALMIAAGNVWAIPMLTLSDGSDTKIVIDGTGTDTLTTHYDGVLDGAVMYNGAVGTNWIINLSMGLINSAPGVPALDLFSVNYSTGPGTLKVVFSDSITNSWSAPGAISSVGGTLLQGSTNSINFNTKINGSSYSTMSFSSPLLAFSGDDAFDYISTGNDFIEMMATISHNGMGATSFDYALNPVPEPGTMVLLGIGMIGLAIYGKRRITNKNL